MYMSRENTIPMYTTMTHTTCIQLCILKLSLSISKTSILSQLHSTPTNIHTRTCTPLHKFRPQSMCNLTYGDLER